MTDNTKDEREALAEECKLWAEKFAYAYRWAFAARERKEPRDALFAAIDRLAALPAQPEHTAEAQDRAALLAQVIELRAQLAQKQGHSVAPPITPHGSVNHGSDERASVEAERAAFEADAQPYGFDLTRQSLPVAEPWSEYADFYTGMRWGGWLARAGLASDAGASGGSHTDQTKSAEGV